MTTLAAPYGGQPLAPSSITIEPVGNVAPGPTVAPPVRSYPAAMDEWLGSHYNATENDHALDQMVRPDFTAAAAANPIVAANGSKVGDVWRTVKMLGSAVAGTVISPAQATTMGPQTSGGDVTDQDAMKWLMEGAAPVAPPADLGPMDAAHAVLKAAKDLSARRGEFPIKEIAANALDVTAQVPFGAYNAVKNAVSGVEEVINFFSMQAGFPDANQPGSFTLPDAPAPTTPAGAVVEPISQFLTGFATGGRILSTLGWAAGALPTARMLVQGAISDGGFFNGQQGKLFDLVDQVPILRGPVTDFLKSDPNDTEAEGRFKNVLNGLVAAPLVPAFVAAVRSIKYGVNALGIHPYKVPDVPLPPGQAPLPGPALATSILGDIAPDAPLTVSTALTPEQQGVAKIKEALGQTETNVPPDVLAKSLTDRGLMPIGSGEVYVNFARINTSDDIKRIIQDVSTATKPMIDAATGGPQTLASVERAAQNIDAFNALYGRRTGAPLAPAEATAARQLHAAAAEKLHQVSVAVLTSSFQDAPQRVFELRQMLATFASINAEIRGASADASRGLGAWRINVAGGDRARQIEAVINQAGGLDANRNLAQKIAAIGNDPVALDKFAEGGFMAKSRDAINQWFYFSALSGWMTHIRNFTGNSVMLPITMLDTATASRLAGLMGEQDAMPIGQAVAQWTGVKMGFADAMAAAKRVYHTGVSEGGYGLNKVDSGTRPNAFSADTWHLSQTSLLGRAANLVQYITTRAQHLMVGSDEGFKTIGASLTGYQQAFVEAQKALARGEITPDQLAAKITQYVGDFPNNLTDTMRTKTAQQAAYLTFNEPPSPGGLVDAMMRLRGMGDVPDASVGMQIGGQVARMTLPFINFAGNAMKMSAEYTPLSPILTRYRNAMRAGGADAYVANAKVALGSMTMATFVDLAMSGDITGKGPSDPIQLQTLKLTGWQANSIKINGRYYSYNNLQPLSTVLGWAANIGEMLANDNTPDASAPVNYQKLITGATFALADQVLSTSFMSQSAGMIGALQDKSGGRADVFVKQLLGTLMVPNVLKSTEQIVDPVQRYTTNSIEEARARLPGFSTALAPKRDAMGFMKEFNSGLGPVYDAISPFYASQVKNMPIADAMIADGWGVGMPPMAFTINPDGDGGSGERVSVTNQPAIYSRYLELRGQVKPSAIIAGVKEVTNSDGSVSDNYFLAGDAAKDQQQRLLDTYGDNNMVEALNGIVSINPSPELKDLSDQYHETADPTERQTLIRRVLADYGDAAKAVLFNEYPDLIARAAQLKAAGVPPEAEQ